MFTTIRSARVRYKQYCFMQWFRAKVLMEMFVMHDSVLRIICTSNEVMVEGESLYWRSDDKKIDKKKDWW